MIPQQHGLVVPRPRRQGLAAYEISLATFVGAFAGLPFALLFSMVVPMMLLRVIGITTIWSKASLIGSPLDDARNALILGLCASGSGIIAGGAQWFSMPPLGKPLGVCLLTSMVGWALGWPIALSTGQLLHAQLPHGLALAVHVALVSMTACSAGGIVVGAMQSIVLWDTVRERLQWTLASVLGWCVAGALILLWLAP